MKHALYLQLLFCLFVLPLALPAQLADYELTPAKAEEVGMSSDRLALLDELIQTYVDRAWLPGGVFLIARHGKVVYHRSFGHQSTARKKPYENDDIFRLASMTKAVTTVGIMQLFEQGKLGIDDPVHRYLPAFKDATVLEHFNEADSTYTTVPAEQPVTIRHLLTHTSGIIYGEFDRVGMRVIYEKNEVLNGGLSHPEWTSEEFIDRLGRTPLAFQPGERFNYGLNMDVLGRIIEVVSGQSLSDYFRQHIFEPLGIEDIHFYLPADKHERLVPVYTYNREGELIMTSETPQAAMEAYPTLPDHPFYAGGGGLSGTAIDYARFIQALVNGGTYNGARILGPKTIEMMTADQLITLNGEGKGFSRLPGKTYCLGFELLTEAGNGLSPKSPGTYEWGGYFNTKFFIDPAEDLIFVGMTQIVPFRHGEFWERLTPIVYGAIVEQ